MVHFYGAHVTEGKAVSVSVPEGYVLNVVHASLASGSAAVLSVETTGLDQSLVKVVVGTLRTKTCDQIKLDLVLGAQKAKFSVTGDGVVHLSGYHQPGPPELVEDEASEINRLSVADLTDLIQKAAARIPKEHADELEGEEEDEKNQESTTQKKRPHETTWDQDEDSDDDDDDESEDVAPKVPRKPNQKPQANNFNDPLKRKRKKKKNKKLFQQQQ
ncbi:hypothetical protein LEN26_001815 [Aphanomyces euteiches]|nr:hypothetical protein AeMF1_016306 [Aphanomyces euteiches]KAH9160520.1 hypothetical protein LEN26_001815 [Aphanomyces euteiches]KAH9184756.1 hypothetical protein AeNC1_013269 [Aphanomyces euteiches]